MGRSILNSCIVDMLNATDLFMSKQSMLYDIHFISRNYFLKIKNMSTSEQSKTKQSKRQQRGSSRQRSVFGRRGESRGPGGRHKGLLTFYQLLTNAVFCNRTF